MEKQLPKRADVPVEDTWDLQSIFATDADWEAAIVEFDDVLKMIASYKGRLSEGASVLADWCEGVDEYMPTMGKIMLYGSLGRSTDMANQQEAAKQGRSMSTMVKAGATAAFAEPEILAIGFDTIDEWIAQEPRLVPYRHYFDSLRLRQAHVRSSEVEGLLSQLADPFSTANRTHSTLTDADLNFDPVTVGDDSLPVAQSTIGAHITDGNRDVRQMAWDNYADAFLGFKNTLANTLNTGVKQHVFTARARRYSNSLEAALKPNFVPVEVFHQTIATFRKHLPTWHRYWRVRRQALGYDKLHVYDIKAPLTSEKPQVTFEQSMDWICEGMAPLGDEYVVPMRRGAMEQRWVDKYPNEGKRLGAFSAGFKGTHPFIFMSYTDDLFSLSTLAHELGHSMHSYFSGLNQRASLARYTLFVAEVASNFNQAMVRHHLLNMTDDRAFQIGVLEEAMSNFHRYFFIMPTLARFELEIHERAERGQPLTSDILNGLMADLFAEGYGDGVVQDRDRIGITWAQFPNHMYSNFYVYQYTTGIAGAHALADRVLTEGAGAAKDYMDFLKAGNSVYPLDALRMAGVDMTSPEPMEKAFGVLASYVDRLEALVG